MKLEERVSRDGWFIIAVWPFAILVAAVFSIPVAAIVGYLELGNWILNKIEGE